MTGDLPQERRRPGSASFVKAPRRPATPGFPAGSPLPTSMLALSQWQTHAGYQEAQVPDLLSLPLGCTILYSSVGPSTAPLRVIVTDYDPCTI
jgi:hypothetical protein